MRLIIYHKTSTDCSFFHRIVALVDFLKIPKISILGRYILSFLEQVLSFCKNVFFYK